SATPRPTLHPRTSATSSAPPKVRRHRIVRTIRESGQPNGRLVRTIRKPSRPHPQASPLRSAAPESHPSPDKEPGTTGTAADPAPSAPAWCGTSDTPGFRAVLERSPAKMVVGLRL